MRLLVVALLLAAWAGPSVACDGTPPKLVNKDDTSHGYQLVCGKKTEDHTIDAGASHVLEGKSGCTLKLGTNKATKLFTEMVCTIKDSKLTCDLL